MSSNLISNLQATPYPIESITKMGRFEDLYLQIARHQIMGHQGVNIFGYSTAIGNVEQAIWEGSTTGGTDYVFPTSAAQLQLVSTSASDGTSLNVQILGLDSNFNVLTEIIALNGTTAVTSVNSYYRVNGLYVTNGTNVGTIKATQGGSTVYAYVNPGIGFTQMAVYTVPNGYTFYRYLESLNSSFSSSNFATVRQQTTYNLATTKVLNGYTIVHQGDTTAVQQVIVNAPASYDGTVPFGFPGGADIKWQAQSSGGGVNGAVSISIYGILVQNDGQALATAL
jgi:hypothetical protein